MANSLDKPARKKTKYMSKYNKDWEKDFVGLRGVKSDPGRAECTYCMTTFSVSSGGKNDVKKHFSNPTHERAVQDARKTGRQTKMDELRGIKRDSLEDQVAKAEALWATFVSDHNLPFAISDCFSDLARKMFPDSKIAEKFSCRRTKTAAVITEALAPMEAAKTTMLAQQGPCAIMVDESNKLDNDKTCAILLRVINPEMGKVQNRFLDMPICNKATGANLFAEINKAFE